MALARQLTNVGARGQDARYDIAGLQKNERGNYTDGTYEYDANGLDLSGRPAQNISGLRGADENFVDGQVSYAAGGGGGGGAGIPGSAVAAQGVAYAKKAYDTALAKITNQRQTLGRTSGFTFDVDPTTGVMRSMRVDPQSQYGQFQMLNRSQAQRDYNAQASAIDRGLGSGGGLAAQLRSNARFQSGQEDADFSSTLIDTIAQLAYQQQEAKNAYDMAVWQAMLEAARAAQPRGGGYTDGGGYREPAEQQWDTSAGVPTATELIRTGAAPMYQVNPKKKSTPVKAVIKTPRDFLNF